MGNTFEVYAWELVGKNYKYVQRYAGESFDEAIDTMKQLKDEGIGCVKLEWRGTFEVDCINCNGTGKEICNNPDHEGIERGLFGSDNNRLGCPVCGHDELHRTKDNCIVCNGTGTRWANLKNDKKGE